LTTGSHVHSSVSATLDAIDSGQPFRTVLRDLGLTSNQVWGLTKTDQVWSAKVEAALTATRRDDLDHGTNAAYVAGCVCRECRENQRVRMAKNRRRPTGQQARRPRSEPMPTPEM
jgi:hypothetical protein